MQKDKVIMASQTETVLVDNLQRNTVVINVAVPRRRLKEELESEGNSGSGVTLVWL